MIKKTKSKYKSIRNLTGIYKNLWGNNKKDFYRSALILKRKKLSSFGKVLLIKQSLKLFYSNIKERCFKCYLNSAVKSPSKTMDKFISILESRLDTILFRSLFAFSFFEARQLITHGLVYVNKRIVFMPKKKIYFGDYVYVHKTLSSYDLFKFFVLVRSLPNYLEINYRCFTIAFLWRNNLSNTYYPVNTKYSLLTRFYK